MKFISNIFGIFQGSRGGKKTQQQRERARAEKRRWQKMMGAYPVVSPGQIFLIILLMGKQFDWKDSWSLIRKCSMRANSTVLNIVHLGKIIQTPLVHLNQRMGHIFFLKKSGFFLKKNKPFLVRFREFQSVGVLLCKVSWVWLCKVAHGGRKRKFAQIPTYTRSASLFLSFLLRIFAHSAN